MTRISFHAMPSCPHLTFSHCGYTLLALKGLSTEITTDQIKRITVGLLEWQWRPMGTDTVMLIPGFKQEAQVICIHPLEATEEAPPAPHQYRDSQPDLSMGLGRKPHNSYLRRDRDNSTTSNATKGKHPARG
jgi:hypothetical protein